MDFIGKKRRGFTILEVMMAIGIVSILGALFIGTFSAFRSRANLDYAAREITSTLRLAQSKTLASENDSVFGVHFESDRAVLFMGDVYDSQAPSNAVTHLPQGVILSRSLTGGGDEVVFGRLTGKTSQDGILILSARGESVVVEVEKSGSASIQWSAMPPAGNRFTDTRHVNYALGWSIQNAATLKFAFADPPAPDSVFTVPMDSYFNPDKTSFDWSGTFSVNGASQALEVHTVSLSPADTLLSVHRGRAENSKAVTISIIDGGIEKEIAAYTAAGTSTPGAYGGTMQIQ